MGYIFFITLLVLFVLLILLAIYLFWQAMIPPASFDRMFEVVKGEPIIVRRGEKEWELVNLDTDRPIGLAVETGDDHTLGLLHYDVEDGLYKTAEEIPNSNHLAYTITFKNGVVLKRQERFMPFEGANNFRDLGGYSTSDGRQVAWKMIFRSDGLHALTGKDQFLIKNLGIRTVCDLRSSAEILRQPDVLSKRISYRHLPVYEKDPLRWPKILLCRHLLEELFSNFYQTVLIDQGAAVFGELLHLAAESENYPMVIHCTGGKDRTGFAAALLLHICGVCRNTIVMDYSLTNLTAASIIRNIRESLGDRRIPPGFRVEQLYPLLSARPELLENAFRHIETKFGSIDGYIDEALGLSEDDLSMIRQNLVIKSIFKLKRTTVHKKSVYEIHQLRKLLLLESDCR